MSKDISKKRQELIAKMQKNLGNVYAIITSKGYALGQVADIEDRNCIYLCRIFNKLYKEIPENVADIIAGKEDYIVQIMMPSMTNWRVRMAKLVGKFDIPRHHKKPKHVKSCTAFGGDGSHAPWDYWGVVPNYLPLGNHIPKDEWVIRCLGKDLYDKSWKEDFKKLNPGSIWDGGYLIKRLEQGWSLDTWLPSNFNQDLKTFWTEFFAS